MSSMKEILPVEIDGITYQVAIKRKWGLANFYIRLKKDGNFEAHTPLLMPNFSIINLSKRFIPKILKRVNKEKEYPSSYKDGYLYLLGNKEFIGELSEQALNDLLKKKAKENFNERLRYYERIMGVNPPYKLRIKEMSSRYGSNSSKTHTVCLDLHLIHYGQDIIDSVVIHELAHHFVKKHNKDFYSIVLKYMPNYYALKKKLHNHVYDKNNL